jgi:putative ABC transport system permease protein
METLVAADADAVPDSYRIVVTPGHPVGDVGAALVARLGPGVRVELLDTGVSDLAPMLNVLRIVALILVVMAAVNLLTTMLTTNRQAAGRIGVELAIGFSARQIVSQAAVAGAAIGAAAAIVGLPLGYVTFRVLADAMSRGVGVGPGWMPMPGWTTAAVVASVAVVVSAGVGAIAVVGLARRPASELLHRE